MSRSYKEGERNNVFPSEITLKTRPALYRCQLVHFLINCIRKYLLNMMFFHGNVWKKTNQHDRDSKFIHNDWGIVKKKLEQISNQDLDLLASKIVCKGIFKQCRSVGHRFVTIKKITDLYFSKVKMSRRTLLASSFDCCK